MIEIALKQHTVALLLVFTLILAFTPLSIIALVLLVSIGALLLPLAETGILTRLVVSFITLLCANTLLAGLAWTIHQPLHARVLIAFYSLTLLALSVLNKSFRVIPAQRIKPDGAELVAAILGALVFFLCILPITGDRSVTNLSRITAFGGDNISHIELINASAQKLGYSYSRFSSPYSSTVEKQLTGYPEGFHFDTVFINDALRPLKGQPLGASRLLLTYWLISSLWLALFAYLFAIVCFTLSRSAGRLNAHGFVVVCTITGLLFTGSIFALYSFGFLTQIAALAVTIALILLIMALDKAAGTLKNTYAVLATIMATSTAFIWLYLLPVAITVLFIYLMKNFNAKKNWRLLMILACIAAIGLIQLYVQQTYSVKHNAINEPGFIIPINNFMLLSLAGAAGVYAIVRLKLSETKVLLISGLAFGLFSLGVLIYQLVSIGQLRYYYYKSAYDLIVILAILLAAFATEALYSFLKPITRNGLAYALAISLLLISGLSLVWAQSSPRAQLFLQRKPYGISLEMADAITTISKDRHEALGSTIAIGSCNREQDIKAEHLITSLFGRANNYQDGLSSIQFSSPVAKNSFKEIALYRKATSSKIIIISSDYVLQQKLMAYLGSNSRNIEFIKLGDAASGLEKPVSECPDRLH